MPFLCAVIGVLVGMMATLVAWHRLPSTDGLLDYRPKVPMHIYSADGVLIGEFGEERRTVVRIADFPEQMKHAILAAEDDGFYQHGGVEFSGIARAALANLRAGGKAQGASTITMQVARNFFLSRERSYVRKLYEILMSLKIEQALTKDQILELYANQIFLGQRSYGFASAAETYFGKPLNDLSVGQYAMLAGLPKAPSTFNPVVNPKRARERQLYVLGRMQELGYLTTAQADEARKDDVTVLSNGVASTLRRQRSVLPPSAQWVSELARQMVYDLYKEGAYTSGLNVYTTVRMKDQDAANQAVRQAVINYDRKYGYRGPEAYLTLAPAGARRDEQIADALDQVRPVEDFPAAVVLLADPKRVELTRGDGRDPIIVTAAGLKFVSRSLGGKAPADQQIRPGAVVRLRQLDSGWEITQVPQVEAAFVSLNTHTGAVRSLIGGFDFALSKFNRVTQSIRQPGSALKPFIYSAALDKGFMTSTLINDAPIILSPTETGGQLWEPKNSDGRYDGPITLRNALARSKNMVSIRILQSIGVDYAQDYLARFGFRPERNPAYLTMALGAGAVTPWQLAGGISVFANGGFRIEPYLIDRITDMNGKEIAAANPVKSDEESARIIDARNAFLIDSMLQDVVRKGTAKEALKLKRSDLAGKTGTTNEAHDAWFAGYGTDVSGVAWVGFDQPRTLGDREYGGGLALPIWINALKDTFARIPEKLRPPPPGIVQINNEYYYDDVLPGTGIASLGLADNGLSEEGVSGSDSVEEERSIRDQLF